MEAELGNLFVNCQRGSAMCMALIDMGQVKPPTPAVTDSATGDGFVNDNIRQRCSRAIDMCIYWVRDRVRQGRLMVYWMAGEHNIVDYFNKHRHHQPPS